MGPGRGERPVTISATGWFELLISGPINGADPVAFEIEVTAAIEPQDPGIAPSLNHPGEPPSGGCATITMLRARIRTTIPGALGPKVRDEGKLYDAAWLLDVLPRDLLDSWRDMIYECWEINQPTPID